MEIIQYILNRYAGEPCLYEDKVVVHFREFDDDDYLHNCFNLTSLYLDFLKHGDKTLIDDSKYFIDINPKELIVMKNDYQIVLNRVKESVYLDD